MSVLLVLTNWKRPANVRMILHAVAEMDPRPARVAVVDNAEQPFQSQSDTDYKLPIDRWRFPDHGPPSRFAPALLNTDCEYTLFLDDDLLPGRNCIAHFLETAKSLNNQFATLGQIGRRYCGGERAELGRRGKGDWRYVAKNIGLADVPTPVDLTCRAHFVQTSLVKCALMIREQLTSAFGDAALDECGLTRNDDMLLCQGIQHVTGMPSYLIPRKHDGDVEYLVRRVDLPAPHAVSAHPQHKSSRDAFIRAAVGIGWKSLWVEAESRLKAAA